MEHKLILVMGRTVPILTETVWHLCVKKDTPLREVLVLTTEEGKRHIEEVLFKGRLWRDFCEEYGLYIDFDPRRIIVLKDRDGQPLEDIRTPEECEKAGEQIADFVRRQAEDPQAVLHCSVAGGRKTMGTHLSFALQLFGREQDTLSHILVHPPELERCRTFFYPPREAASFEVDGRPITEEISLDVATIPFVHLRHVLKRSWLNRPYAELVKYTQKELGDVSIRLDLEEKKGKVEFRLEDMEPVTVLLCQKKAHCHHLEGLQAAYYSAFLLKTKGHDLARGRSTMELIQLLYPRLYRAGRKAIRGLQEMDPSTRSKTNACLRDALAHYPRQAIERVTVEEKGGETIALPPERIEVCNSPQ